MLNSEIIFKYIEYTLDELKNTINKPVKIRREFVRFITLTQQLTESMRKEYKNKTGTNWEASLFSGWNNVTKLFKELRKIDYHDSPITLDVNETQHHLVEEYDNGDGTIDKGYIVVKVKYNIGDPFQSEPISIGKVFFYDEDNLQLPYEEPEIREYTYSVKSKDRKINSLIDEIGEEDVVMLATMCFQVLSEYTSFYLNAFRKFKKKQ